jgi:succinate dehydrogenase / fumarate reductase iron-sulfur subunit/fumarate reductase iron-sulfur subunit
MLSDVPHITLSIQRSPPEADGAPRFQRYQIDVAERATVLDALLAVQRGSGPDLAFRFSCRVGMCGSCAMVVNGREQLACSTLLKPLGPQLRVEPLRNLPVIRDLVVDLAPFFAAYQRVMPHFVPRKGLDTFYSIPHASAEWKAMDHQPQCIDCAACYSACTLVTLHPRYLGPMALHRARILTADPRDAARDRRMEIVSGEAGAFRCHTLGNCRQVCPRGISPTASIQRLKREAVGHQLRAFVSRLFGFGRKESRA